VEWIDLAVNVDRRRALVNLLMNISVSIKCGESDGYLRQRWLLKKEPVPWIYLVRIVLHFNIVTELLLRF
jgi:hypothetical protein